ncbi:MAG: helix-turn-helix domain-containing protein [Planctomycetes bacterium]|nr:helix-turn-helix domain-containing protein [Planctomycetota bacterium]
MRGRTPVGPELTEKLAGSTLARERMQVILETIAGECRVQEACEQLGICQQRFERLRVLAIEAGIAALELKPAGRPAKVLSETEIENIRLQQRIAELEAELKITHIRVELATQLPQLGAATKNHHPGRGEHGSRGSPARDRGTPRSRDR